MSTRGGAGRVIGSSLLNIAALGGLVCIVLVMLAFFFNITLIMFKTGSMSPTIPTGSLAVVREIPASEIKVGDVLTVDRSGKLPVTHRVTSVSGEGDTRTITMKGDANETEDPTPYVVNDARKVLVSVPGLAKVVVWFSNPLVLGGITVAASVLVTWAFWPRTPRDAGRGRGSEPADSSGSRTSSGPAESAESGERERGSGSGNARGRYADAREGSKEGFDALFDTHRQTHVADRAAGASGTSVAAKTGGALAVTLLLSAGMLGGSAAPAGAVAPTSTTTSANTQVGPMPIGWTRDASGEALFAGPLLSVEDEVETRGAYLTLTSIGDAAAMADMQPGVPVLWQVGVQAHAPDPGIVRISLLAEGASELGLSLEIRSCTVRWVAGACSGDETLLTPWGLAQLGGGPTLLTSMGDTDERWILVTATVPAGGTGQVALSLRADGESGAVVVGPGSSGVIARTGTGYVLTPWLGLAAVASGLLVAAFAAAAKRGARDRGGVSGVTA